MSIRVSSAGIAALLVSACAHSAPQPLPSDIVPAGWETATSTDAAASAGGGANTSTATAWWRAFGDPVLDQMVERARTQSLDVKLADARIREARALRNGSGAELWPELDASAGASISRATSPNARNRDFQLGLDASWEVDLFGRLRSADRASASDLRAAEADRDAVALLISTEVAAAYIEYRLRRVQLVLAEKTAEAQEGTVRITRARFGQGTASRFDLERTIATLASTRARIPEAAEQAAEARHRLSLLLAESPQRVARELSADRPLPNTDPLIALARPDEVVTRRPDIRGAEQRLWAALARRDSAEALRYPRLTLSGMVGLDSDRVATLFDPASVVASLAAGLFAPIFDFGRIRAQIDVADARQEQAYLAYEQTVRTAMEEAETAIIFYAQGVVKQKELGIALSSAQKAAEFARIQYREGTLSLLEVLDAERGLHDAELSWSEASADVSVRLIAVHRTLGG